MKRSALICISVVLSSSMVSAQTSKSGAYFAPTAQGKDGAAALVRQPVDTKIVTYRYGKDRVYPVLATLFRTTLIELAQDEQLEVPPAGADEVLFKIEMSPNGRFLAVKALEPNMSSDLTLITNKRTYHFDLISSEEGGKYYKHVRFSYPDTAFNNAVTSISRQVNASAAADQQKQKEELLRSPRSKTNLDYIADKPGVTVFDDGVRTFFKGDAAMDAPVIYKIDYEKGFFRNTEVLVVVPFSLDTQSGYTVTAQLSDEWLVRYRNQDIRIKRDKKADKENPRGLND